MSTRAFRHIHTVSSPSLHFTSCFELPEWIYQTLAPMTRSTGHMHPWPEPPWPRVFLIRTILHKYIICPLAQLKMTRVPLPPSFLTKVWVEVNYSNDLWPGLLWFKLFCFELTWPQGCCTPVSHAGWGLRGGVILVLLILWYRAGYLLNKTKTCMSDRFLHKSFSSIIYHWRKSCGMKKTVTRIPRLHIFARTWINMKINCKTFDVHAYTIF